MRKLCLILLLTLFMFGCGLDRSNPLDPSNGNIKRPGLVTEISLATSGQGAQDKYINITWQSLKPGAADGYYIYRSRSYDGTFQLVAEIPNRIDNFYQDRKNIVAGAFFYKMSAFLYLDVNDPHPGERLEGPLNIPAGAGIVVPK